MTKKSDAGSDAKASEASLSGLLEPDSIVNMQGAQLKALRPDCDQYSALRFSPHAWAKLTCMCHSVSTEIGGIGIGDADDPLLIVDIVIPKQVCDLTSVKLDSVDMANTMVELCDPDGEYKLNMNQCSRVWIHTHPGGLDEPSGTDEATFSQKWGQPAWAVMFILCQSGATYCRMRMRAEGGMEASFKLPSRVDWSIPFEGSDQAAWRAEIREKVSQQSSIRVPSRLLAAGKVGTVSLSTPTTPSRVFEDRWFDTDRWSWGDDDDTWGWGTPLPEQEAKQVKMSWEKSEDKEAAKGDDDDTKVIRSDGWAPRILLGTADLLFPLADDDVQLLLSKPITVSELPDRLTYELETLGLTVVDVGKDNTVVFEYTDCEQVSHLVDSTELARFTEPCGGTAPADEVARRNLVEFETRIHQHVWDRSPTSDLPDADLLGRPLLDISPWLTQGGDLFWLSNDECSVAEDIRDGFTAADMIELSTDSDTPEADDEAELLFEAMDLYVGALFEALDEEGAVNLTYLKERWVNLDVAAKAGGWADSAEVVKTALRDCSYDIEAARRLLVKQLEVAIDLEPEEVRDGD